jgi:hypothetical protein
LNDTPKDIIDMIEKCWDKDRQKRLTSIECFSILDRLYNISIQSQFDIFLSHAWTSKPVVSNIYIMLTVKFGYRVWYDMNNMGHDLILSMVNGIKNSKIFICCLNQLYQTRENCLFELRKAVEINKTILTISLDSDLFVWSTPEVKDLCQISTKLFIDISNITSFVSSDDNGKNWYIKNPDDTIKDATADMTNELEKELEVKNCFKIIKDLID